MELMLQRIEAGATRHVEHEIVEAEIRSGRVELDLAARENHKVVTDHISVVGVMSDEDDANPLLSSRLGDVAQHNARLRHAKRRRWFVEDQDTGAEVDGAGDRDHLTLATGKRPHRLLQIGHVDAHLAQLHIGLLPHPGDIEPAEWPGAGGHLRTEKKVPPDRHEQHHRQGLVDGRDTVLSEVAPEGWFAGSG
jgi:hypothetical protein